MRNRVARSILAIVATLAAVFVFALPANASTANGSCTSGSTTWTETFDYTVSGSNYTVVWADVYWTGSAPSGNWKFDAYGYGGGSTAFDIASGTYAKTTSNSGHVAINKILIAPVHFTALDVSGIGCTLPVL